MTLRLTVQRAAWTSHVRATADAYGAGIVPVVKGNGYGFGRSLLHEHARAMATEVCVGSVHELHDVPEGVLPVVLTPTLVGPPSSSDAVCTVGRVEHVHPLVGSGRRVVVKLASSMQRYGATPAALPALMAEVSAAALTVHAYGLHLPLAGDDVGRLAEIESWLPALDADVPLWVSHLSPDSFRHLVDAHPDRSFRIRVGTALWHGAPKGPFLHLGADVADVRRVRSGDVAGYRHSPIPFDGTLVAIAAGTASGVAPLDTTEIQQRSPFHFGRQRMPLLELPHMHTSLVVVRDGDPVPEVGDIVDVQRPLTAVQVDELAWT